MPTHATTADVAPSHKEPNKFHIYLRIARILAIITGIEMILVILPFPGRILIVALAGLSALKFLFVILCFMHLRWDKVLCTILFFIGLVLASGTMWALLRLFGAEASKPISATIGMLLF